jgi:hypothetical protein
MHPKALRDYWKRKQHECLARKNEMEKEEMRKIKVDKKAFLGCLLAVCFLTLVFGSAYWASVAGEITIKENSSLSTDDSDPNRQAIYGVAQTLRLLQQNRIVISFGKTKPATSLKMEQPEK